MNINYFFIDDLIDALEDVTEPLIRLWLRHCRGVRFSPLEAVADEEHWRDLMRFIESYGHDLFTQQAMNFGNLRAIMYQGVDAYLRWLEEHADEEEHRRLFADLDGSLPRDQAIGLLGITIEAVLDNYNEYMDYNSSTTQSDQGEMLYTLVDFLRGHGRRKVLFGTNYPMLLHPRCLEGFEELGLDEEAERLFLSENAARVFGLEAD